MALSLTGLINYVLFYIFTEAAQPRMIFDRSLAIKQINVVEAHGLLIFRAEKGNIWIHNFHI